MNDYHSLIRKIDGLKSELDFLESAHKQHVFKFLAEVGVELARVNIYLIWDSIDDDDFDCGLYQVIVLDERPVFQYDFDVYSPISFEQFKSHFQKCLTPYVAKKKQVLQLEAHLKLKGAKKGKLKI